MASVYTVKQINSYIKHMFSEDFALTRVYVKGEVSNCKYHTSGHIYFTLKDPGGVLKCVMFAGARTGLKFRLQDGQMVVVFGSINVYERDGTYQLYAKEIILDGSGLLYQRFEELKQQLNETGLFDDGYKKPLPAYAMRIGIVTAYTGAAIRDIINIANRRNPYVQLYLYNALVQGEGASDSIVCGIEVLDSMNLDVLIVGRGGGSLEDLWAFNEEKVAYAIFQCHTPVISAVGHETDVTIADFVADRRAPTPSAAAELAVFEYSKFLETMSRMEYNLRQGMNRCLEQKKSKVRLSLYKLQMKDPRNLLHNKAQYLDRLSDRMVQRMKERIGDSQHRLALLAGRLDGVSPLKRFDKGFVFAADEENRPVKSVEQLNTGDILKIHFRDGSVRTQIFDIKTEGQLI